MPYSIRPFNLTLDLARIVELVNTVNPEPVSEEAFRTRHERKIPGQVRYTAIGIDDVGVIGGFVSVVRHPWLAPGQFWARIIVDPALRHRGLGELLYQHTLDFLRTQPATHLLSEVQDACSEGLTFAQQRGFTVQRHLTVSRLTLAAFDPAPFAGTIEEAEATGIRFFTLADVEMTLENQRKLYGLHRTCAADNPAYEGWGFPDSRPSAAQLSTRRAIFLTHISSRQTANTGLGWLHSIIMLSSEPCTMVLLVCFVPIAGGTWLWLSSFSQFPSPSATTLIISTPTMTQPMLPCLPSTGDSAITSRQGFIC